MSHSKAHYERMGQLGGGKTLATYGLEYYVNIGRQGGLASPKRDRAYYVELGKKRAEKAKRQGGKFVKGNGA